MDSHIDLLLLSHTQQEINWHSGEVCLLTGETSSVADAINRWSNYSKADYLLLCSTQAHLPSIGSLKRQITEGLDLAHVGSCLDTKWSDLYLVIQDWTMISGSHDHSTNTWWASPEVCLLRRDMLMKVGGWDGGFESQSAATLEMGYRSLKLGALVEYRPELLSSKNAGTTVAPPLSDFYLFLLRHYGSRWTRYVWIRRSLRRMGWLTEQRALQRAVKQHLKFTAPLTRAQPVWYDPPTYEETLNQTPISVIIPTLGRYPYLPQALESLRQQTVQPREVIVVDQNPPEQRQPETYQGYEDLNLQVIWQDERGQSLARNTGLAAATSPYIFLFDDDSIADPDLIAAHLQLILNGRCHVSTGVAFPPDSSTYQLLPHYRHTRLAQTFDTGNSLLPLDLARKMGGLDRNYDFGPGTDTDFGTRLYLAGYRIAHNPQARRIHFKAPMGGLRAHGARKYNTDAGLWQPFPPVTRSYYGLRYLSPQQRFEHAWLSFFTSKFPRELRQPHGPLGPKLRATIYFGLNLFFFPIKWFRSQKQAQKLLQQGVRLAKFASGALLSY